MLVVNRFVVTGDDTDFRTRAGAALAALGARPGYVRGRLGRAYDEPGQWMLITEWESVGAYRRALSAYDVKVNATPLLAQAQDEASAFEILGDAGPGGPVTYAESDLARS
ncbi:MAG: antibiotic biosynthesis monooxygenase [Actinobacteria bacterium 13_1_20CM_3_71_11]|nr:MAG: antibiotic biosynthesis monooxygenase [Actinobacteria bacterium 13_1_20CM_3_71_11]